MQTVRVLIGSGVRVGVGIGWVGWLTTAVGSTTEVGVLAQAERKTDRLNKAKKAFRWVKNKRFNINLLNHIIFLRVTKAQSQIRFISSRVYPTALSRLSYGAARLAAVAAVVKLAIRHQRGNFPEIGVQFLVLDIPERERSQTWHIGDITAALEGVKLPHLRGVAAFSPADAFA